MSIRWSSNAFLGYIRKQVEQFSKHVAKWMLTFLSVKTIPDIAPYVVSNDDPWQRNHCNISKTRHNIGRDKFNGCIYRCSLFPTDLLMMQKQLMEYEGIGGRKTWNNFQFQTQPPSAHLVHLLLSHVSWRCLASCFVDWTQTEEGESGGLADKKFNFGKVFNFLERGKLKLKSLIPTSLFNSQWIERQPTQSKIRVQF